MKRALTVLIIALIGLSQAQVDYGLNEDALGTTCTVPTGYHSTPVNFVNPACAPYGVFELTLPDISGEAQAQDTDLLNVGVDYTGGSLNFNGTVYQTYKIVTHVGGEHAFYGTKPDLELQIYLTKNGGTAITDVVGVLSFGFYSFIGLSGGSNENEGRRIAYNTITDNQIITSLSDTDWTMQLSRLANTINSKDENDLFLNVHYYKGIANFPDPNSGAGDCQELDWFVYGGTLLIEDSVLSTWTSWVGTNAATLGVTLDSDGQNSLKYSAFGGSNTDVTKLCYTGYFQVTMYANYGLWFSLGLCLLFFMFTLGMDLKPLHNFSYVENPWTNHPIYSVWFVGNEIFSRKSRVALIYIQIINFFVWNAVFFKGAYDDGTGTDGENVITFALQTLPISWGIGYIIGYPLRKYYIAKGKYEESNNGEDDDSAQYWIYIFYTLVFLGIWVGCGWTVALMDMINSEVEKKTADLWVAAIFIDLALEYLLFDPIAVWVTKKWDFFKRWSRWRGYIYDDVCHKAYLAAFKKE